MRNKSFLVVDDSALMRQLTTMSLKKMGCGRIEQAGDGAEALGKLREYVADVVLTDIDMPGVGGLEFIGRAREEFPALPIIVLSTRGNETIKDQAMELGAANYLTKPFSAARLAEALEKVFPDLLI